MIRYVLEGSHFSLFKQRPYFIGEILIRERIVKPSEGRALLSNLASFNSNLFIRLPVVIIPAVYFLLSPTLYAAALSASVYAISFPLIERSADKRIQELEKVVKSHLTPENIQKVQTYLKNPKEPEVIVNGINHYLDSISTGSHKLVN